MYDYMIIQMADITAHAGKAVFHYDRYTIAADTDTVMKCK